MKWITCFKTEAVNARKL